MTGAAEAATAHTQQNAIAAIIVIAPAKSQLSCIYDHRSDDALALNRRALHPEQTTAAAKKQQHKMEVESWNMHASIFYLFLPRLAAAAENLECHVLLLNYGQ